MKIPEKSAELPLGLALYGLRGFCDEKSACEDAYVPMHSFIAEVSLCKGEYLLEVATFASEIQENVEKVVTHGSLQTFFGLRNLAVSGRDLFFPSKNESRSFSRFSHVSLRRRGRIKAGLFCRSEVMLTCKTTIAMKKSTILV